MQMTNDDFNKTGILLGNYWGWEVREKGRKQLPASSPTWQTGATAIEERSFTKIGRITTSKSKQETFSISGKLQRPDLLDPKANYIIKMEKVRLSQISVE